MLLQFRAKPYIAIIGDLIHSREYADREAIQQELAGVLQRLNETYEQNIAAKFLITLGDEFQGLLVAGAAVMDILTEIEEAMWPVKIRFGVGIGTITTAINPEMSLGADGPAFYNARDGINELKRNEKKRSSGSGNIRLVVSEERNREPAALLNTLLMLMATLKEAWSDRQREAVRQVLKSQDSQKIVAARLGIAQPTLNMMLKRANYYAYKEALETVARQLQEVGV